MQNKPFRPALAAARIWTLTILTGPLFFILLNRLYFNQGSSLPILQADFQPDYFELYTFMIIPGLLLAIIPFLITWAMLDNWTKKRLPKYLIAERLILLNLLFTTIGILLLMNQINTQHPLAHAMLLFLPYFMGGLTGILIVLGWPFKRERKIMTNDE